jgi:hypothetical protein
MTPNPTIQLAMKESVSGRYRLRVMNADGTVAKDCGEHKNLILPAGVGAGGGAVSRSWGDMIAYCHAGTGTTPNSAALSGTFSQTGTTITRVSGVGVFASGNVNDFVKFAGGQVAKIASFTNTVTVEADRSQSVAAAGLTVYDCSRVALDAWVKQTNTTSGSFVTTQDTDGRSATFVRTFDFAFEVAPATYTEIGISATSGSTSQLLSRVVLDTAVDVDTGQFLQVEFSMSGVVDTYGTSQPIAINVTGWPRPYSIASITANGTYFDIVLTEPHHYAAGRPVIVTGALPATVAISTITSTSLDFTVNTAAAHGKSPGDSIVIAGSTPPGYNGTWTVATVIDADSLTVNDTSNLGAGSGGTLRFSTPGTWFNGTHTAASFPTTSTIRVTSAITPPAAGAAGNVTNSTAATAIITGIAYAATLAGNSGGALDLKATKTLRCFTEANLKTGLQYGVTAGWNSGSNGTASLTTSSYDVGLRTYTFDFVFASAVGNGNIRQIAMSGGAEVSDSGAIAITFDERQIKEVGFALAMTLKHSWEPDLS